MTLRQQTSTPARTHRHVLSVWCHGTIRYVADGLAHTEIPLGLAPADPGHLLARTLRPLER